MLKRFDLLSVDGKTRLQGYHWPCEKPWAVLQITHGMAEHLLRYDGFAKYLNQQQIAVIGHDHLGHGASIYQQPAGYFHDSQTENGLVGDLHQVTQWGKKNYPEIPFFVLGHSMGSFVLRNYLTEYGTEISGAILVGTGQQPAWLTRVGRSVAKGLSKIQGEKHPSWLIDRLAFGRMNRKFSPQRTDKDWLVSLSQEVDNYLADPACGFLFTLSGYQELFSQIIRTQDPVLLQRVPKELPLLFLSGSDDPVGEFGKGVLKAATAYQGAGVQQVTVKLYEGARHELLNETQKPKVFRDICKWIEKISGK